MNFEMNKSQKEIQKAAGDFAKGEFDKDIALDLDKTSSFPDNIWKKAGELGFIGIHFPENLSGGGLGVVENVLVAEEFCKKDSTIGSAIMFSSFAAEFLLRFGSEKQKEFYLPEVAAGKQLSGGSFVGFSNVNFPSVCETTESCSISGELDFMVNGGKAGFYCVPCTTGEIDGNPDNISVFLLCGQEIGLAFGENQDKLGLRMTPTAKMILNDVIVSKDTRIGNANSGRKQIERVLGECRVLVSAMALGIAQGAFDRSLTYVKQREQFGKKIARFQVTQHKLAEMAVQIEQSRYLVYSAAFSLDNSRPNAMLSSMAKLSATRTALSVSSEAVQLLGGYGYMKEYEAERYYRDAKTLQLMCGSASTLKDNIAASLIGRIK